MTQGIKPQDNVLLHIRNGEKVLTQPALVLGISMNEGLAGAKGEPSLEVVTVNPAALRHAGTSDWHQSLLRMVAVIHTSHKDWQEGRASLAYEEVNSFAKPEAASHPYIHAIGDFSQNDDPYGIAAEYSGQSFHPDVHAPATAAGAGDHIATQYNPPPDAPIASGELDNDTRSALPQKGSADSTETPGANLNKAVLVEGVDAKVPAPAGSGVVAHNDDVKVKPDAAEPGIPYTVFIDGKQVGEPLTEKTNLKRADGSLVLVTEVKEGDELEDNVIVAAVEKEDKSVKIVAVHK